jgi:hypothetical protein
MGLRTFIKAIGVFASDSRNPPGRACRWIFGRLTEARGPYEERRVPASAAISGSAKANQPPGAVLAGPRFDPA